MTKYKLGILGASNIAFRRFLPALQKSERFEFAGIAAREEERCKPFTETFGGRAYPDYESLLKDPEIDCVYLPLPPALHAVWGERVLRSGKHLLLEKPFSTNLEDTRRLLELSENLGLAVHENYMFRYHRQLTEIKKLVTAGVLGSVRMIRAAFTFPLRGGNDFRYQKELGGGALLDCGGYPLTLVRELMGSDSHVVWSDMKVDTHYGVETSGSAVLQNGNGLTAHIFFGMDDTYRCDLEVWGSKASLTANRIFTAPADMNVTLHLKVGNDNQTIEVGADDQFLNSIECFGRLIDQPEQRTARREDILREAELVNQIQHNIYNR